MSRMSQFLACLGWVAFAVERIEGDVSSQFPVWMFWIMAAWWLSLGILAIVRGARA